MEEEDFLTMEDLLQGPSSSGNPSDSQEDPNAFLDEDSRKILDAMTGIKAGGTAHRQAGEMFRLAGANWNVDPRMSYNASLAANQSFGEQLKNTVVGGAMQFAAGFLDNFNYDLPDMAGMMAGQEKEYGSWLSEISKDIREGAEAYPIYQEGDSFADPAYWAKQGQNLSYSVGLITGAFAEQAALSYATLQTGGSTAAIQAASVARKGQLAKSALFGAWKGIHEGYINGLETYNNTLDTYLRKGKSYEEAVRAASQAASLGYRSEVGPLMALNALQFGIVGKYNPFKAKGSELNLGFSGAVESLGGNIFKEGQNKYLRAAGGFLLNGISEGVEEGIQTYVSKNAEHTILKQDLEEFGSLQVWDQEMTDSIVGGILGGFLFGGIGSVKNAISENVEMGKLGADHDAFIAGASNRVRKNLEELQVAEKNGNEDAANAIRTKMRTMNVFEALQLDYLNQKETAFDSYTKTLEAQLAEEKDPATQKILQESIDSANRIKRNVVKNLSQASDPRAAFEISHKEESLNQLRELRDGFLQEVSTFGTEDPLFKDLTPEQQQDATITAERAALVSLAQSRGLTDAQKARLQELKERGVEASFQDIDPLTLGQLFNLHLNAETITSFMGDVKNRLKYWRDPKNQEKERKELVKKKAENLAKAAKNSEQIDKVKKDLSDQGELTVEVAEELEAKEQDLKTEEVDDSIVPPANTQEGPKYKEGGVTSIEDIIATQRLTNNTSGKRQEVSKSIISNPPSTASTQVEKDNTRSKELNKNLDSLNKELGAVREQYNKLLSKGGTVSSKNREAALELNESIKEIKRQIAEVKDQVDEIRVANLTEPYAITNLVFGGTAEGWKTLRGNREAVDGRSQQAVATGYKIGDFIVYKSEGITVLSFRVEDYAGRPGQFEISFDTNQLTGEQLNEIAKAISPIVKNELTGKDDRLRTRNQKKIDDVLDKMTNVINSKVDNIEAKSISRKTVVDNKQSQEITDEELDQYFSPTDQTAFTPEQDKALKAAIKDYYDSLKIDTGKKPSFENFIADFRLNNGVDQTREAYQAIVRGWELNNYAPGDYKRVYDVHFTERNVIGSRVLDVIAQGPTTPQELAAKQQEQEDNSTPKVTVELDENKKPRKVKANTPYRVVESQLKFAFLSRRFKQTITQEDGEFLVENESLDSELHQGSDVDSTLLLNPNYANEGTEFTVVIPENKDSIRIRVWEDEVTRGPSMTFGAWVTQNNIQEGSQEWLDKVPMVIQDSQGRQVSFIHDVDWYNPINVGQENDVDLQDEIIEDAQENVRNLRKAVVDNNGQRIKVTEKRLGTFVKTKPDEALLSLQEANPQTILTVFDGETLRTSSDESFDMDLLANANQDFEFGHTYEIRQMTNPNEYMAFPILREPISEDIIETIYQSALVYLDGFAKEKQDVEQKVKELTGGLSLYNISDFQNFLHKFVMFSKIPQGGFPGGSYDKIGIAASKHFNSLSGLKEGQPYIFTQNSKIFFGRVKRNSPNKFQTLSLNLKSKASLDYFREVLKEFRPNIQVDALGSTRGLVKLNEKGQVIPSTQTYKEYLMENLKTNVKSFNVGTEQKPIYATAIQPMIFFEQVDTTHKEAKSGKVTPKTITKVATKVAEEEVLTDAEEVVKADNQEEVREAVKEQTPDITNPDPTATEDQLQKLRDAYETYSQYGDSAGMEEISQIAKSLGAEIKEDGSFIPTEELSKTLYGDLFGMTIIQNSEVVDAIFNLLSINFDFKHGTQVTKKELYDEVTKQLLDGHILPRIKDYENTIANLEDILSGLPQGSSTRLQNLVEETKSKLAGLKNVEENWVGKEDGLLNQAYKKLIKYSQGIEIMNEADTVDETSTEQEVDYSKTSLEDVGKDRTSYRLRRFLRGIKDVDENQKVRKGYLDVDKFIGFNTAYDKIKEILNSPNQVASNLEEIILRLEENIPAYPWLKQVVDSLRSEDTDQRIKNEFAYNFPEHNASYKFVMFSVNRDGKHMLSTYDSNSGDVLRVIKNRWKENLKSSLNTLSTTNDQGEYIMNIDRVKHLINEYETNFLTKARLANKKKKGRGRRKKSTKETNIDVVELQTWLANFGIELSKPTLIQLKKRGLRVGNAEKPTPFKRMFDIGSGGSSRGLFGVLYGELKNLERKHEAGQSLEFVENEDNNPLNNIGAIGDAIARIESKYNLYTTTKTFRDGGKMFSGYIAPTLSTEIVDQLTYDEEFRKALGDSEFNSESYMLALLNSSYEFRKKFGINQLGNTAIKELGKRVFGNNSITDLPQKDHELAKLGLFQDKRSGAVKTPSNFPLDKNYIKLRMARMFLPTMSDKSRMSMLQTAVLEVQDKHIKNDRIDNTLLDFLGSQLILPELKRMVGHAKRGGETNIKGYDFVAKMFTMIPSANRITYKGTPIIQLIEKDPEVYNSEWIMENLKDQIRDVINEYVVNEVNNKVGKWRDYGFIGTSDGGTPEIKFMDSRYINSGSFSGNIEHKARMAAFDFVINSALTNANTFMLIAGDPAMYGQDKIKKYFKNGKVYAPNTEKYGNHVYEKAVKEVLSTNMSKRLANLVAPGKKLQADIGETYNQLFLNDFIDHSTNLKLLAETLDKKELKPSHINLIRKANAEAVGDGTLTQSEKESFEDLKKEFPGTAPFFSLEATDAQEYVTASEHLNVLWGQGRVDEETYYKLKEKIKKQKEAEKAGKVIPQEALFDTEELSLFFQPIKPVYTGFKREKENKLMRMVYIKSSSIPLLPQVTAGFEIDGLRKLMEAYESNNGPVRASYQSANKVGANKNALHVFDSTGKFRQELLDSYTSKEGSNLKNTVENAFLVLDREGFKIQQDVPFSAEKKEVTMGTQTLKLLFGDGVTEMKDFQYLGESLNGQELRDEFNNTFNDYINLKRESLLGQLGLNKDGTPRDIKRTKNKLQKLLQEEAEARGYPRQDVEALKFIEVKGPNGRLIDYKFQLPPWISPNSNRYESLLNAIVNNRLIKLKVPGTSYVVASEAGFQMQSEIPEGIKSRVLFTNGWSDKLEAANIVDNKVKHAQVLVPSKFRDNDGELIEFVYSDGTYNEAYVTKDKKGVLRIKEEMFGDEIKNIFSFRIPTSSHVSMSKLEVVGFLPPEVGDLMIVPKNLTQQKGLDFDIDKETAYQFINYVNNDGKITKFGLSKEWEEDAAKAQEIYDLYIKPYRDSRDDREYIRQLEEQIEEETETGGAEEFRRPFTRLEKSLASAVARLEEGILEITEDQYKEAVKLYNYYHGKKAQEKVIMNKMIQVHMSVFDHPRMFKKSSKALSMDFAKRQAELISQKAGQVSEQNFSFLSDEHQKEMMAIGASGKLGIGVYSNYVVFNSLIQQLDYESYLTRLVFDKEIQDFVPVRDEITIGKLKSSGTLGVVSTLGKNSRSTSEAFAEKQNTATDNAKEQIMGMVNVNEHTINVDAMLTLLGFDKVEMYYTKYYDEATSQIVEKYFKSESEKKTHLAQVKQSQGGMVRIIEDISEVSLPYLLLSQPIIKEFVEMKRQSDSFTEEYNPASEEEIVEDLKVLYELEEKIDRDEVNKMLTGPTLFQNLEDPSPVIQHGVLNLFMKLRGRSKDVGDMQKILNINNGGLGRSFFDVIDKYDMLATNVGVYNGIEGSSELIGDVLKIDNGVIYVNEINQRLLKDLTGIDYPLDSQESVDVEALKNDLIIRGFFWFENKYLSNKKTGTFIRPKTPNGSMLVQGVHSGYNLWKDFFPYSSPAILSEIDFITDTILSRGDLSGTRRSELRQKIFQDMKKYFLSNQKTGFHGGKVQEERGRLFFDIKDFKFSLATYLKEQMAKDEKLRSNKLLSKFEFKLESNGLPSLIKFDNSKSEDFDEDYLYLSLLELMQEDRVLEPFNDKPYTTKDLAEDLIKYAYLSEPIQEAIQYIKYIPITYLNNTPFAEYVRNLDENKIPGLFSKIFKRSPFGTSDFSKQYAQHNPQSLPKFNVNASYIKGKTYSGKPQKDNKNLDTFFIDFTDEKMTEGEVETLLNKPFISLYNDKIDKGLKKFQLYQLQADGRYHRIPVLGIFGMNEYQSGTNVERVFSIVNPGSINMEPATTKPSQIPKETVTEEITAQDYLKDFINSRAEGSEFEGLAEVIQNYIPTEWTVQYRPFTSDFTRLTRARGLVFKGDNTIYINSDVAGYGADKKVDEVFFHEVIHLLTKNYVDEYITRDGQEALIKGKENTPSEILALKKLYDKVKNELFTKEEIAGMTESFKNNQPWNSPRERLAYGVLDIHEFMTFALTNAEFQEELKKVEYGKSGKSFFDKFVELVKRILGAKLNVEMDGFLGEVVSTVLEVIEQNPEIDTSSNFKKIDNVLKDAENALEITNPGKVTDIRDLGILNINAPIDPALDEETSDVTDERQQGYDSDALLSPLDIIYNFDYKTGIYFLMSNRMPFSQELIENVMEGKQSITIRGGRLAPSGLYKVGDRTFLLESIAGQPIDIDYLYEQGLTKEQIEKEFKGIASEELRIDSVKSWFNGNTKKYVYYIKDVTSVVNLKKNSQALYDNYKDQYKKEC